MHGIAIAWSIIYGLFKVALVIFLIWGLFIWTPRTIYRKARKATRGSEYGGFTDEYGSYVPPMSRESWIEYKRARRSAQAEADKARRSEMRW